jgi:ankyrin repeat protein
MSSHRCDPENLEILQLLLGKGADVNAVGGEFGTALQAAAYHHRQYVEVLLKHGADNTITGGKHGNALGAANKKGLKREVKLLS